MDTILSSIIIIIMLGMLYLLFKPKKAHKTKEKKQDEIYLAYKARMDKELVAYINDEKLLAKEKIALLKVFTKELNRNIFFDVPETKALIQKLILHEIKKP